MAHCNQRVRFAATWREEFFEVPKKDFASLRTVRLTPEASDSNSRILGRYRIPQIPIGEAVRVRPKSKRSDAPYDRFWLWRQRQKRGVAVAMVEFDGLVIDFLVRNLWLTEREACDRSAVGAAISRLIADTARR